MTAADGFANMVSRLAVTGDKTVADTYVLPTYSQVEIEASYRSSWLARKVIDVPPFDSVKDWRDWQAKDDQIEAIEAEEKRLQVKTKVRKALTWGRLYGGAALILGAKQGSPEQPLKIEAIATNGLQFVHAVTRYQLTVEDLDRDPMSEFFGQPTMYAISGQNGMVRLHPSRVIRFVGQEIPDYAVQSDGWGDPLWMTIERAVKNADLSSAGIAALVHEAKTDVIHVPGLLESIGTAEFENRLVKRFTLAMMMKSITNALLLDGGLGDGKSGEVWDRKEISFAGLTDVAKLFLSIVAAAADIPATRLLGKSPDGMNATGEGDLRNYYDMIKARQEMDLAPALEPLDEILIRSALGSRPDEIYYEWAPLHQATPAENAEIEKKRADTAKVYADTGLIPNTALAKTVQNQMVESGQYPGLEGALEEAEKENDLPPITEEPSAEELAAVANAGKANGSQPPAMA